MGHNFSSILLGLLIFSFGCASYGWADGSGQPADRDSSPTLVQVETLIAPAHLGLNVSKLRTILIEELELAGVMTVQDSTTPALRCTLSNESTRGFSSDIVGEIDLSCRLLSSADNRQQKTFDVVGLGGDAFSPTSPTAEAALVGSRRAEDRAAVDAITQVAPRIADELNRQKLQRLNHGDGQ